MEYDEFLSHFGSFGWFNFVLLVIIGFAGPFMLGLNSLLINYIGSQEEHWCAVPELNNYTKDEQVL